MEWIQEILIQHGLAGAVIFALGLTVVFLYKAKETATTEHTSEVKRLNKVIYDLTKEYGNDNKELVVKVVESGERWRDCFDSVVQGS